MLTITAVTIRAGTRVFSSVTKVPPMVCRVLVSQLGVPSATGPIWRATSPRATPTTRARSTCAENGTRRRRASTEGEPFGGDRIGTSEFAGRRQQPAVVIRPKSRARRRVSPHRFFTDRSMRTIGVRNPDCDEPLSVGPDRVPFLQERGHAFARPGDLAGRGHDLDRGVVGVPL